jgi:PAS domain S-box-containing protein
MSISSTYLPPLFTSLGDNIFEDDLDMDFKILSEYLFDDQILNMPNGAMPNSKKSQAKKKSKSLDYISNDTSINDINMDSDGDDFSGDDDEEDFKLDASKHQRVDKRRERNRVLARKTRLRKKFFFESLQRQVAQLTKENEMLKGIAKQNLKPETLHKILSDCSELPACVVASTQQANSILEKADYKLMAAIQAAQRSFCISDPSLPDNPIVFASAGFLELTGYTLDQVIGRNCRFLQGPKTDPSQVEILKKGIIEGNDTSVCIINYKADGTEFHNQVFVAALRDENHKIVNYVGVQVEVN